MWHKLYYYHFIIYSSLYSVLSKYIIKNLNKILKEILKTNNEKRFKINNILYESTDDFVRKMKLTGIFSIRGYGRFLDINTNEINKINYILLKYSTYEKYDNEYDYYKYMSKIDNKLINIDEIKESELSNEKLFEKWVNYFDMPNLCKEIKILANKNQKTNNEILKFINNSLRLEFLTALILKKKFINLQIKPNYKIDDEGMPTSFASGGKADIICIDKFGNTLFEVTLLTGTAQNIREMPAITRHLKDSIREFSNSFAVLICPKVSNDTLTFSKYIKYAENLDILPISIPEFIESINSFSNIQQFNSNRI